MLVVQVMGRWVSVEVLLHGETNAGQPMVTDLGMCPVVFLNRTGDDSLRLLWSEPAGDLTYHLKIMYPSRPDFWVVIGPQRGNTRPDPSVCLLGPLTVPCAVSVGRSADGEARLPAIRRVHPGAEGGQVPLRSHLLLQAEQRPPLHVASRPGFQFGHHRDQRGK